MHMNPRNPAHLDVFYMPQTWTATCGPACLMMVMKYYQPSMEFSRKLEFALWQKSFSVFLLGGTFQYGLAAVASTYGFITEVYQQSRFAQVYPKNPGLAARVEKYISSRARHLNIPIFYGTDNMTIIHAALQRSIPPIVFVNLHPILGENVFHWVVVTGLDDQNVYMNDPYVPQRFHLKEKKDYPVSLGVFSQAMATGEGRKLRLPPCVLYVYK